MKKILIAVFVCGSAALCPGQQNPARPPADAVARAQTPAAVQTTRPEQNKTGHDTSNVFDARNAVAASPVSSSQPNAGKITGFDFYRDPLNADRPNLKPEDVMKKETANKPAVMEAQQRLARAPLRASAEARSGGEDVPRQTAGSRPHGQAAGGMTWERLAAMRPEEIRQQDIFPYPALPHPLQANGGQVFPKMQIDMFPRLERFDVEFDLPEAFLPEFPPAIFLTNRPELGDVSRGEVVSINNYYRLFKDLLTPVQLDGLRLLLTPFPQEEFNPTDDRKTSEPSLGVTCFDCHVNGHTTGQFHLTPDMRPQERRFRLDTTSLRGVQNQQIHSSKRSLRSVEDFTEFEQRTAYFNGDEIHAIKKGMMILDRVQVSHMAQMQNMLDFPPAPKLESGHGPA